MPLRTPPLRDLHADRGAKFTEFGGWDMPVEFGSIRTEHEAVRQSAGLFDVSHMGEVVVSGPDATALVDRLVTNDVAALDAGEAVYAAITDAEGIMHDDTVVYRLPEGETHRAAGEAPAYLFVPNAGHDEWAHERWCDYRDEWGLDATVENVTDELDGDVRETAVRAVDALDLDVAGVDVIGTEDDPYVLEVNATAGFKGLFEATGVSPAPHIARLAIERAGGDVDDAALSDHETRLADEWPACAPDLSPEEDFRTVGYTESVDIAGGGGIATAIAKSDTGAKRTTVDLSLAAEVGAGPLEGTTSVRSGSSKSSSSRPLVTLDVRVGDRWHEVTADVIDREHMNYPVLLGRDILDDYFVDVSTRAPGDATNEE